MTKLRAQLVSRQALSQFALTVQLGHYILLGKGEEASGGRKRSSTLADALEALVGAIYLDSGYQSAKELVLRLFEQGIGVVEESTEVGNPKGTLQEILQSLDTQAPRYQITGESGPDHRKVFHAQVLWRDMVLAQGRGKSKKEAEVRAALEALRKKAWSQDQAS